MGLYCRGDTVAFRGLYALAAPRLFAYVVCLVRDRAAAEELLQQTFVKLHEARAAYVHGADPVRWLYTIAHRTCLDEMRRRKRSRVSICHYDRLARSDPAMLDGGAANDDEAATHGARRLTAVLEAVENLPENQRKALVLTQIEGKSMAETAAILGTTPGAVKLRAHRGRAALRERLAGIDQER
jgi:RNA polymerase sigma-70 factor (ECF subfamily)